MEKHLILVGGGQAHLLAIANLDKFIAGGNRATVIGPSDDHYYSGMVLRFFNKDYIDRRFMRRFQIHE